MYSLRISWSIICPRLRRAYQDSYRESSAKIGAILSEWAASLNGILKEYERDKYILLFEERYMNEIVAGKFEILDRINAAGQRRFRRGR